MDSRRKSRAALVAAVGGVLMSWSALPRSAAAELVTAAATAVSGTPAPETPGHTGEIVRFASLLDPPAFTLNDNGLVAFGSILSGDVQLPDPIPPEHPGDDEAVYLFHKVAGTKLLARRGDEAQGFPEGGILLGQQFPGGANFVSTVVLNNQGNAGLRAMLSDMPDPDGFGQDLIHPDNDAAIYYGSPAAGLTLVAREGSALPVTGLEHLRYAEVTTPGGGFAERLSTNNDTLVFASDLGAATSAQNPAGEGGTGIFRYTPGGGVGVVAISKSLAGPGSGVLLEDNVSAGEVGGIDLLDPRPINAAGSVMFRAMLAESGASVSAANDEALLLAPAVGTTRTAAREGQAAAGLAGVTYSRFNYPSGPAYTLARNAANSADLYAFKVDLAGAGVSSAASSNRNVTAVFSTSAAGTLGLLARENMAAPGVPAGSPVLEFSNEFHDLRISESGWVAFRNQLRPDGGGADGVSNLNGIFLGRVTGAGANELREVAVEGDQTHASMSRLGVTGGDAGELVDRWNTLGGGVFAINSQGQVAFRGSLADSGGFGTAAEGFYLYDPAVGRVAKVIAENDTVVIDGVTRRVESVFLPAGVEGGSGDGGRTFFNDNGEVAAWVTFEGGGEALLLIGARDLLPAGVGTWSSDSAGNWSDPSKWTGPRNGAGIEVNFTTATAADRTVTVDAPQRVGSIFFDNANRYTLAGPAAITLDVLAGNAKIGVINGSHTIAAPLVLDDSATVIVEKPISTLTFSGNISGAGGLTTGGKGTILLSGSSTYAGPTTISNGVLQVSTPANLGNGGAANRIVLDGGVLRYAAPVTEARAILVTESTTAGGFIQGGIDTAGNDIILSGPMSYGTGAFASAGYLNKLGNGKLTLSGTGGPGGIAVRGGSLEIASNQSWGPAQSRLLPGTSLTLLAGKTLTSAPGGGITAEGGSTATFNGPFNLGGHLEASYTFANKGAVIHINAPGSASAVVSGISTGVPSNPAERATVNVNAPLTLTGTPASTINHTLNIALGASMNVASNLAVSSTAIVNASGPITVGRQASLFGTVTFNAGSGLSAAALQVGSAGGPAINLTRDVFVIATSSDHPETNGKIRTLGSSLVVAQGAKLTASNLLEMSAPASQSATINGTLDVGGIQVGEATASANGATLTINGTATATSKSLPGPSGPVPTSGALVISAASLGTSAVAPTQRVEVNSGGALNTTGVTLATRTTSAVASATPLAATLTLNVKQGATLGTGHILVQADERLAGKNLAQNNVHIAGLAGAKSIRYQSSRNGVAQAEPNAGRLDMQITGRLEMLRGSQGGATSVLRAVPGFGAPAAIDTGRLDLNDNDLVINYVAGDPDQLPRLRAVLASGRNVGNWDGVGIGSLAAKNDASRITGLAYGTAADVLGLSGAQTAAWSGVTVDATSLLVKHTYNGDANLSGTVEIGDFFRIDRGYSQRTLHSASNVPGYGQGNFDFDQDVDAADYMLIDRAFLGSRGLGPLGGGAGPAALSAPASAVPEPGTILLLGCAAAAPGATPPLSHLP